ncbi:MAG: molecular chaperone TorD family protein [Chloroflexi bacterium]|nr:molecular chaperone TorD family protein [Chloroflexota bacterium]
MGIQTLNREQTASLRSDFYQALAEALSDPPEWLAEPGREWPLYGAAAGLAPISPAARLAAGMLSAIEAEPYTRRLARYVDLFAGSGRPRFWLYESAQHGGRLLGSETWAVDRAYRLAGLEISGAELPDHVSIELAFLAYLAAQQAEHPDQMQEWQRLEWNFIRKHAGRWMPGLGRALASLGDEVYSPLGRILSGWLEEAGRSVRSAAPTRPTKLPALAADQDCTLCGFCSQSCPSRALWIEESKYETHLVMAPASCTGCGLCARVCPSRTLELIAAENHLLAPDNLQVLRSSPRLACPSCGRPTVSRAELDFIVAQIGPAPWLEACPDCRPQYLEKKL